MQFELFWSKWLEPPEADYRLYFVMAKLASQSDRELQFKVMVTKASFPREDMAFSLFETEALREIKARLEFASKEEGPPLFFTSVHTGWFIV